MGGQLDTRWAFGHLTRAFLLALALVLTGCSGRDAGSIHSSHTNVLWLTVCTLRSDRLGVYGHSVDTSPNLDRMARRGVWFLHAFAQAPWTRPSMGAMVTGVYPRSLNIEDREQWPSDRVLHEGFETIAERLKVAGYETFGVTANPNTNATFQFDRGYDHYRDTGKLWRSGYARHKLTAEQVTRIFEEWVDARRGDSPFFAHLVFIDLHQPLRAGVAERRLGAASRASLPKHPYDLQIRYVDDVVGALLEGLRSRGLEDTLVVVSSDHGEGLQERGSRDRGHGPTLYQTRLAVPFIVNHPQLPRPGHRVDTPVEVVDMVPTLLDLVGVDYDPADFDGRSLVGAILSAREPLEREVYVAETAYDRVDRSAITRGEWKLILDHKLDAASRHPEAQLYRLPADPRELDDLASAHPELVSSLRDARLRRRGGRFGPVGTDECAGRELKTLGKAPLALPA